MDVQAAAGPFLTLPLAAQGFFSSSQYPALLAISPILGASGLACITIGIRLIAGLLCFLLNRLSFVSLM